MNKAEALLILPVDSDQELDELYEQKCFEWKNFFVHRFPIPKLFEKKIAQLNKLSDAYHVLSGQNESVLNQVYEPVRFNSLRDAFNEFTTQRNQLKVRLFACSNALEIINVVQQLLSLTKNYAEFWRYEFADYTGVLISKEPDAMELLDALSDAEKSGVKEVGQIEKLRNDHMVVAEAKRLSLWLKKEEDE